MQFAYLQPSFEAQREANMEKSELYFERLCNHPMLTREGEVELARILEKESIAVIDALTSSPLQKIGFNKLLLPVGTSYISRQEQTINTQFVTLLLHLRKFNQYNNSSFNTTVGCSTIIETFNEIGELKVHLSRFKNQIMKIAEQIGVYARRGCTAQNTIDSKGTCPGPLLPGCAVFQVPRTRKTRGNRRMIRQIEQQLGIDQKSLHSLWESISSARAQIEKTRDEFVRCNLRLVLFIARNHQNRGMNLVDIFQEGNIGLMKAVNKFDYRTGCRFQTYAVWWIHQTINRSITNQARTIRVPVHRFELAHKISQVQRGLSAQKGCEIPLKEIAAQLHMPEKKVVPFADFVPEPTSLDAPIHDDGEHSLKDILPDIHCVSPYENCATSELHTKTRDVLKTLTPKEEMVVRMRFGIGENCEQTLNEIGQKLGVTRERIRQIETLALRKLRNRTRKGTVECLVCS